MTVRARTTTPNSDNSNGSSNDNADDNEDDNDENNNEVRMRATTIPTNTTMLMMRTRTRMLKMIMTMIKPSWGDQNRQKAMDCLHKSTFGIKV